MNATPAFVSASSTKCPIRRILFIWNKWEKLLQETNTDSTIHKTFSLFHRSHKCGYIFHVRPLYNEYVSRGSSFESKKNEAERRRNIRRKEESLYDYEIVEGSCTFSLLFARMEQGKQSTKES